VVVKSGSKIRVTTSCVGVAAVLVATLAGCSGGENGGAGGPGDGAGNPFEGEAIDFVVPFGPGGGYDVYARTIAPYLEECLGARIVVLNEPGAGSLLATNKTATSPPDGSRIQIMNMPGVVSSQIAGDDGAQYDLNEFSWIGRIASPPDVVLTGAGGDLESFEDIVGAGEDLQFVATGPGSSDYIAAAVLAEAYGIASEIATGFAGAAEATNAVVAGNADVHVMPFDSVLATFEAGDARPVALLADEVPEYMPDAPLIGEFEPETENGQEMVDQLMAVTETGRAVAAPPGLPEDRLTALQEGFTCAMENEELLDELSSQERPVNFMEGEEYAGLVEEALNPSEDFAQVVKDSF
jgi:tripartite-type tricarboxylate transporter receptor subunit TctC